MTKLKLSLMLMSVLCVLVSGLSVYANPQEPAVRTTGTLSYGDGFPHLSVDYFGLLKLADVTPPRVHMDSYNAIVQGRGAEVVDELLQSSIEDEDDVWSHLLLVHAADSGDRLVEIADSLHRRSSAAFGKRSASALHLGSFYANAFISTRDVDTTGLNFGVNVPQLRELRIPEGRISIMMWASALWRFDGANSVRAPAVEYLKKDSDFYQLRTFFAHSLAYGSRDVIQSDGSIIQGSGYDMNLALLQTEIGIVVRTHPSYGPAYFVAVAGASERDAISHAMRFLDLSDPNCNWHIRAKRGVKKLKGRN